jgi:hypothetical protein
MAKRRKHQNTKAWKHAKSERRRQWAEVFEDTPLPQPTWPTM